MKSALLYDTQTHELDMIDAAFRDVFARHSDDFLKVRACDTISELNRAVKETEIVDMNFIEAVDVEGIGVAEKLRKHYPESAILLVVSDNMKPTEYIKPGIMASALIMRPSSAEEIKEILSEFVLSAVREDEAEADNFFFIDTPEGKTRIPYDKIIYIEARQKKIFIRLKREEYGIKETLESMLDSLPENFIKCHRSFIVNKQKITGFNRQDNTVILEGDINIPVSRPFRQMMRDL